MERGDPLVEFRYLGHQSVAIHPGLVETRIELAERGEPLRVFTGRQTDDRQPVGVRVHDGERALADRAGRSEDGNILHTE